MFFPKLHSAPLMIKLWQAFVELLRWLLNKSGLFIQCKDTNTVGVVIVYNQRKQRMGAVFFPQTCIKQHGSAAK